jgi:putative ABC transport system permease protein
MLHALRVAQRQQLRRPAFAATVVSTLALAIGGTTAVFSVVNAVLVRALPFRSSGELVWVASVRPDNPSAPFTLPEYMDYRGRVRSLSGLAAYASWSASLAGDELTERLQGARISANAFEVLGAHASAGRLLQESDDRPDAPKVVVISRRLWLRRFAGSPGVVGSAVRINAEPFVVVGVLPAQFPFPLPDVDVMTPLVPESDPLRHLRGSVNFLRFFGRLGPGADARQAAADLTAICRSLREQFPVEYARKESVKVVPLQERLVADFRASMLLLLGAVAVVLATALANLVSLALVRATERRAELAMRTALGASRLALARQLGAEACVLAATGTGLGVVLASQAVAAAVRWAPPTVPRLGEAGLDGAGVLLATALGLLAAALLAIAPLGAASLARAGDALRSASRGAVGDRWNQRVRKAMVVAEISAALVLLVATGVLVQGLRRLHDVDPGFRPDGVFQARVSLPPSYRSADDVARFHERLSDRLAGMPGVEGHGVISVAPFSGLLLSVPFTVEGAAVDARDKTMANLRAISPGYPAAVGTRLLAGRPLSESDGSSSPHVALVSAALAARFLPGGAVGKRLLIDDNNTGPRPVEIVGVLAEVRHVALDLPPPLDVYLPLRQTHPDGLSFVRSNQFWMVRTASDPAAFRATFLAQLRAVDPDAAVSDTGTMRQFLDAWLGPRRFNLGLFVAFALTAVLLAVSGLHGLVSYAVSQRGPEIGLRMAIGATQRDVRRMILRQAAGLALVGVLVGLGFALALRPLVARVAGAVSFEPGLVAATATSLAAVVLVAAWLPARRAARIEPTRALRAD